MHHLRHAEEHKDPALSTRWLIGWEQSTPVPLEANITPLECSHGLRSEGMAQRLSIDEQISIIQRGAVDLITIEELRQNLEGSAASGHPLRIKLGLDPTAPDIHLGHTVVLHKLRQFQELGHRVILVIGDFTGMIGDPTGKSETRKPLTRDDISRNAETYAAQIYKVLDPVMTTVRFNSEWLGQLSPEDIVMLAAKQTV